MQEQHIVQPFFDIKTLPGGALILDVGVFVLVAAAVGFTAYLWKNAGDRTRKQPDEKDEDFKQRRDIGERSMMGAVNVGLTSGSVLMAGAFALLGFAKSATEPVPPAGTTQVILGVVWLVLSIFVGAWNVGIIAPKANKQDVSQVPAINVRQMLQLCSILAGGFSLLVGLFLL